VTDETEQEGENVIEYHYRGMKVVEQEHRWHYSIEIFTDDNSMFTNVRGNIDIIPTRNTGEGDLMYRYQYSMNWPGLSSASIGTAWKYADAIQKLVDSIERKFPVYQAKEDAYAKWQKEQSEKMMEEEKQVKAERKADREKAQSKLRVDLVKVVDQKQRSIQGSGVRSTGHSTGRILAEFHVDGIKKGRLVWSNRLDWPSYSDESSGYNKTCLELDVRKEETHTVRWDMHQLSEGGRLTQKKITDAIDELMDVEEMILPDSIRQHLESLSLKLTTIFSIK